MRQIRFLVGILLLLFLLSACHTDVPDFFAFREQRFSAEIKGSLRGQEFCARISSDCGADGKKSICIEYLSPASLCGVTVSASLCENGRAEDCRISFGELSFELPSEKENKLLDPILALFADKEAQTVEKRTDGYHVTLSGGQRLVLSSEGIPVEYASDTLFFDVVWWE